MTRTDDDELRQALDPLLAGVVELWRVVRATLPATELRELEALLDAGRTQLALTMLLPSGAVRVAVMGDWPYDRCLWTMTPSEPVLRRATQ